MTIVSDTKAALGADVGEIVVIVVGALVVVGGLYFLEQYLEGQFNAAWQKFLDGLTSGFSNAAYATGDALGGGAATGEDNDGGLSLS
jgi:hypothetical protein